MIKWCLRRLFPASGSPVCFLQWETVIQTKWRLFIVFTWRNSNERLEPLWQPWPGVSPTAILNEEKALGTRLFGWLDITGDVWSQVNNMAAGFSYAGFFCELEMKTFLLKSLHEKQKTWRILDGAYEEILESFGRWYKILARGQTCFFRGDVESYHLKRLNERQTFD